MDYNECEECSRKHLEQHSHKILKTFFVRKAHSMSVKDHEKAKKPDERQLEHQISWKEEKDVVKESKD